MRKIYAVIATLLMAAQAYSFEFIYWQLDESYNTPEFNAAMIWAFNEAGDKFSLTVYDVTGEESELIEPGGGAVSPHLTNPYYSRIDVGNFNAEEFSFYVELYMMSSDYSSYEIVGSSTPPVSYSDLALAGKIYAEMGMEGVTPYTFYATSKMVPEPTGGLLVLLGVGALALRRKRVA